jgi:mannitol-1-phosphate/altronate dehydrogenase
LEIFSRISVIGVGVTEGGLSSASNQAMVNLAALLRHVMKMGVACENPNGKICIINTDNVPNNGSVIFHHMMELAKEKNDDAFVEFLKNRVTFHNTMVDRITSQRPDSDGMVPRCEPVPAKACVVEDLDGDLPPNLTTPELKQAFGWVVRSQRGELSCDIALKLRVANGTHTAAAHVMALVGLTMTDALSSKSDGGATLILDYLDALFQTQILPAATPDYGKAETKAVYEDWRRRLCHAHFGLSTFFITQNGAAKGGIRIAPTIRSLLAHNNVREINWHIAIPYEICFCD